jgi:hypothetical protein
MMTILIVLLLAGALLFSCLIGIGLAALDSYGDG